MNTLYFGDNLNILQRYIKHETLDLDRPFNCNRDYNVPEHVEATVKADETIRLGMVAVRIVDGVVRTNTPTMSDNFLRGQAPRTSKKPRRKRNQRRNRKLDKEVVQ